MNLRNLLAVLMIIGLIVAVSSLVATIFALPFLIFLGIFILAFARPSKYDINRIRAGLGLNENQAVIAIIVTPMLTYLILSAFGIALVVPTEKTINPYEININRTPNGLYITERMVYRLSGEELATEIGRYLPENASINDIRCPLGMKPFNYTIPSSSKIKVGCKSLEGHLKRGEYPIVVNYFLPCDKCDRVDLGYLELDAPDITVKANGVSAHVVGRYLKSGESLELEFGDYRRDIRSETRKKMFNTGLKVVLVAIGLVLLIYLIFGKEVSFKDVPKFMERIPKKRKPYEINLIFYGDPDKIEDGAVIATVLDLARRGYIKIVDDKIIFTRKSPEKLDDYESKVYWTFRKIAEELGSKNTLNLTYLRKKIQTTGDLSWLSFIKGLFEDLYIVEKVPKAYDKLGRYLSMLVFAGVIIIGLWYGINVSCIEHLWLGYVLVATGISGIIAIMWFDIYALGRYLPEYSKERAMWESFKRTLGEYALIRAHAKTPEDLEEWLIYANALGKPENVERVILDTKKKLPNLKPWEYNVLSPSFMVELINARIEELRSGLI